MSPISVSFVKFRVARMSPARLFVHAPFLSLNVTIVKMLGVEGLACPTKC